MKANFETGLKFCPRCKRELSFENFFKGKSYRHSDNMSIYCKGCYKKDNYDRRVQKYKQQDYEYHKKYVENNRERVKAYFRSDSIKRWRKKWNQNESNRIALILRQSLHRITHNIGKVDNFVYYLGCTIEECRQHLENQFQEGMTWDNYGRDGWQIDHIIPCAAFDLSDSIQQRICSNFRNLQPLWAKDNASKGSKIPDNVEELIENLRKEIGL